MPITYEPISTTTLTGTASSIVFDSISSSYTDLKIVVTPISSVVSNYIQVRFNSDANSNYAFVEIYGNGTSAATYSTSSTTFVALDFYTTFGTSFNSAPVFTMDIMGYGNTNVNKTTIGRGNATADPNYPGTELIYGMWKSTSAITRIDLLAAASTFASGTVATLYGIKAA